MKLTTRTAVWGIEIKNDTVTEEIYNTSTNELKETSINLLEAVKDLVNTMNYDENYKESVLMHIDKALNNLEDI